MGHERTAGVILAAGSATRFGMPKQVVRLAGRTMLEQVVAVGRQAGLDPIVVVVPPGIDAPARALQVVNDDPDAGLSRSLRLGIGAVAEDIGAAVILLGDQPTLAAETVALVRDAATASSRPVTAAVDSTGVIAPPVLLRRDAFGLVADAIGDEGLGRMLAARPDMVEPVRVPHHPPDVDTPADLDAIAPACPGCGARVPAEPDAPIHAYIGASPGCWARWSELIATTGIGGIGRHANDAYAAQHPGVDGRRQRQSVAVHLIALCHWLEHGITDPRLTQLTRAVLAGRPDWAWLAPPSRYGLTVHDLPIPASAEGGRRWAESVWEAWRDHHATIRRWAAEVLDR